MQSTNPTRLLHNIKETCEILGDVGRTKVYELMHEGRLRKVKIGARSFVTDKSIRAYVHELESATT